MNPKGGVHKLPADIWGLVIEYLEPTDVVSMRKTCITLNKITQQRFIWLKLAGKVPQQYGLYKSSFPFEKMSTSELEHLTLSPTKFEGLVTAYNGRTLPPATVKSFTPRLDGQIVDIDTIFLVPGGRYLIARRPDIGVLLWDLGYNAERPLTVAPLAYLEVQKPFILYAPVPTPDRKGVRLYLSHEFYAEVDIVDIYPTAGSPEFRTVGLLKLPGQYRPRLQAQTSTHIALVTPGATKIMIVRCPDGPGRPLTWCFLDGFKPSVFKLYGLALFGETLIASYQDKMFVVDLPDFDIIAHGETVKPFIKRTFKLPYTECPLNLFTSEWLGPVEDGTHLLGVYVAENDRYINRWEEYSCSDMQLFRVHPRPEGTSPSIAPVALGEPFPVAGPRRAMDAPRQPPTQFETCIKGNRLQRTPTAFYMTGMVKERDAPLLLVKYRLPGSGLMQAPSKPAFVKLANAFKKGDQWVWMQDVAICHVTGRIIIATPHDQLTGTHEIQIIDYLPPPSSRRRQ